MADCLCTRYARATEWAALAGARWLGRADEEAAEDAAASGMKSALDEMPIEGEVVIGARTGETLLPGGTVGAGGERVDLALDPIEGRAVVARGGVGAMAMLAVAPEGALRRLPDMYMRSIAVGPRARDVIDLDRPVAENVRTVAESFGRQPLDITALVLDRPRHHDLIEELRSAGTRIKLIGDGTVTASISAAIRGTNDHLAIGIGGTRQAVLTAAALRCLGGGMQAQLWPTTRTQIDAAREVGIEDIAHVFTEEDLAPEFFNLRTGLAGEFLQKFVNYRLRVALVVPHPEAHGERFKELAYEHRSHPLVRFVRSREEGEAWLRA